AARGGAAAGGRAAADESAAASRPVPTVPGRASGQHRGHGAGGFGVEEPPPLPGLMLKSAEWLWALAGTGPRREAELARLHELLIRIARVRSGGVARGCGSPAPSSMTWPARRRPRAACHHGQARPVPGEG